MKERGMKLPFTEPCGNGLLRFNNWDGTQLSTTKEKKRERKKGTRKRKESKKGKKEQARKKKNNRLNCTRNNLI